jgi:hypothetical protein
MDGCVALVNLPLLRLDFQVLIAIEKTALVSLSWQDADLKYRMFSCISSGSTNDILAWKLSNMKHRLDQGDLPAKYYFIGDEAFVHTNQLLVPWSVHNLNRGKDSFNYHLSSKWSLVCTVAAKLQPLH